MGYLPPSCRSVTIRDTERVGPSKRGVSGPHAALARADALAWRPWQVWVAVEIRPHDRIAEVLALRVDLEPAPEVVVHARRDPVECIRDRRPPRNVGALVAGVGVARLVVPGDVGAERPLPVEQADRESGGRRGVDGADEV